MAYLNLSNSLRYDAHGRKRRKKKSKKNTEVFAKPIKRSFQEYKAPDTIFSDQSRKHRELYPSAMEQALANGTWNSSENTCAKKESMQYTGTLVKGIATMHKSNAVPIIDEEQAKDIARMRRG